MSEMEVGTI